MSYVENNLLTDEHIVYRAHLHWAQYLAPLLVFISGLAFGGIAFFNEDATYLVLPAAVLLAVAVVSFLARLTLSRSAEFAVTNRRVLIKIGFVRRQTVELLLQQIEGIGVDQTLIGRMLNYGTITVTGTGGTRERFTNIGAPLEFRRQVQNQTSQILVPRHGAAPVGGSFCNHCGAGNPQGANFCNGCGTKIAVA